MQQTFETPVPIHLLAAGVNGPLTPVPVGNRRVPVWAVLRPDVQLRTGGRR